MKVWNRELYDFYRGIFNEIEELRKIKFIYIESQFFNFFFYPFTKHRNFDLYINTDLSPGKEISRVNLQTIDKILCSSTNGVPYFSAVYKQLDKLVSNPNVKENDHLWQFKRRTRKNIYIYLYTYYTYIYILILYMKYFHLIDRDDAESKAHNHYDTRLYFILLFREAGCAMFGFML